MIKYEGRKYSVPTCYIGRRMTVSKDDNDNLNIYYNNQIVVCHALTEKMYNYTVETAFDILKSDAMRDKSDDEIGYLPMDKTGANLFFQLIAKRYEHNSTIITSNQPFSKWGEVFSDATLANTIFDRLLHHSHVIKIIGSSYRTKDYYDLVDSNDE